MPFSAKSILRDSQISLEKTATDKFGTVVEDFTKSKINALFPQFDKTKPASAYDGSWYATSYAATLAGASQYRPKLKFLFKVKFIFTDEAKKMYPELERAQRDDGFTFMIKMVDRPKVDFEYEDDVNMYNFRTKVLKRIRHRDLTIQFMDDVGNKVFEFFRVLMMIHSPITRGQKNRDDKLAYAVPTSRSDKLSVSSGMSFRGGEGDSANRAVINSQFGNSIEAIRVQQIFVDPTEVLERATKMVSFDFINPRIVSFDLDELDHSANDVNVLTMIFDYDWMEMVNIGSLGREGTEYGDDQRAIVKPGNLKQHAPSDISPNRAKGVGTPLAGGNKGKPGLLDDFLKPLTAVLGRGAQQLTSDLIGKAVKTVAGNNRFATAIGGIVSSNISGPIGGIVSGATRERLSGLTSSLAYSDTRATASAVTDSSTAGSDSARSVVSSSSAVAAANPAIQGRPRGGG